MLKPGSRQGSLKMHLGYNKEMKARFRAKGAIPLWINQDKVDAIYTEAFEKELTVDHIVPLKSELVCGLHWEGNMQLLSYADNNKKSNRFWPDMW